MLTGQEQHSVAEICCNNLQSWFYILRISATQMKLENACCVLFVAVQIVSLFALCLLPRHIRRRADTLYSQPVHSFIRLSFRLLPICEHYILKRKHKLNFGANWHSVSTGEGHETVNFEVQELEGQGHKSRDVFGVLAEASVSIVLITGSDCHTPWTATENEHLQCGVQS